MSGKKFTDLTSKTFGRLSVIERSPSKSGRTMWDCICSCGNSKTVRSEHLTNGRTESCGCIKKEQMVKHGMSRTPTYKSWQAMKDRCLNPLNAQYKDYGGRGITICDQWVAGFEVFIRDMGAMPNGYTIDRIDNNLGYNPKNCKWSSRQEQSDNRRPNILIEIDGETRTLKDWSRRLNTPYSTAMHRYRRGLDTKKIFNL